ncbi:hypothetical protein DRQ09_06890, partial [candidate division KSB1 bacterium]
IMINCRIIEKKLSPFIDGELSIKEQKKVIQHIKVCSKCEKKYYFYLNLDKNLKQLMKEKTEGVFPYKEPFSEVLEKLSVKRKEQKMSGRIIENIKKFLDTEVVLNNDVNSLPGRILLKDGLVRVVNVLFIVIGFILLLASPIHGSSIVWII